VTRYVLDTDLYIRASRDPEAVDQLQRFYARQSPFCYLSSVVLHEVLVGARNRRHAAAIRQALAQPFQRTGRIVTPSAAAWTMAAETVARLAWDKGLARNAVSRSFVNDVLIAASCREHGLTIITENDRDFKRIQRLVAFSFVAPWPD
jgi:predicted nucleic acid-binding protein